MVHEYRTGTLTEHADHRDDQPEVAEARLLARSSGTHRATAPHT
jgi:hypothetical protein